MSGPKNHLGRLGTWRARIGRSWSRGGAAEARRQEALAAVAQRALEGADSADLRAHATMLVARILDVPYCGVLAWQPDERLLRVEAGVGWRAGVVGRAVIDTAVHPETAAAWTQLDPYVFESLAETPCMHALPLLRGHEVTSGLSVAIVPRGSTYGALVAYADKRRRFRAPELDFVRAVARLLAIALGREYGERALFEEMQMSTVLSHVGRELLACTEVGALLGRICELSTQALRCELGVTWLRRGEEDDLRPVAADGLGGTRWESLRATVLPSAVAAPLLAALAERDTVRLALPCADHPELAPILAENGIRAAVVAPLRNGGRIVGLQMSGHLDRAGEIGAQDERLALGIAQLASTALVNARVVEELERASQLKSEFVSTMSHELRTPLNIIIGYTEMLADATSPAEQAPLLAQLGKASRELFELIDGTLNLNRLAAGGDVPRFAPVRLAELCRELEDDFAEQRRRGDVALRFVVPDDLEVPTDRRKMKIVLKNLIGNAFKFTAAGEVVVACEPVGDRCRVTVRDTGIGIAADALPHVFEMFRQADGSETRAYGGAGLGLYIVKSLLTQLGGDVQVESMPGQGTIFTAVVPLAAARAVASEAPGTPTAIVAVAPSESAAEAEAEAEAEDVAVPTADECLVHTPRRLLFADDLPLNRLLVRRFVAKEFPNVEVLEACDGAQALAVLDAERPHVVLLDLHMPNLDGWQTVRAIRRRPGGLSMPVIALSVDASPGAEANAVRAGFQEFIAKPISDYSALKARLAYWLTPRDPHGRELPLRPSPSCDACARGASAVSAA